MSKTPTPDPVHVDGLAAVELAKSSERREAVREGFAFLSGLFEAIVPVVASAIQADMALRERSLDLQERELQVKRTELKVQRKLHQARSPRRREASQK